MSDQPAEPRVNQRTAAKARTRAKVLQAATELFAEPGGYEGATIRKIAKRAGMSTGAVFANFEDKAELYQTIHGHPPVPMAKGAQLLAIVRALALNGRELSTHEPFTGALEKLIDLARGRLAEIWPEGLRSDADGQYVVDPEVALENLAELFAEVPEGDR